MTAPRLKEKYRSEIVPQLEKELSIDNINEVPRLDKIVINMGVGEAASDSKQLDAAMNDLRVISGQQPCVTRAKKSIASFHIRQGMAIGCKVTLRGDRMGIPRSPAGPRPSSRPRLPRRFSEELRRPRQLQPRHHRPDDLP